jgi:hypothetical protein
MKSKMTLEEALKISKQEDISQIVDAEDYSTSEDTKDYFKLACEAFEKQIPKEVDTDTVNRGIGVSGEYDIDFNMLCPNCNSVVGDYEAEELWFGHCPECGQKLKYTISH